MEFPGYFVNTTSESPTTTEEPTPEVVRNDMKFLIVPLIVVVAIMILSALVYLMAKKRKMELVRHKLLSLYDFDSNEREWESFNSYDNPNYAATSYYTTTF